MGGIKNYRRKLAHDGKRTHVHHKIVVAKAGAALGDEYAIVSRGAAFLDDVLHVPGRDELSLFYVYGALGHACCYNKVGLTAQKRWDLQHIRNLSHSGDVLCFVHIGQHWYVNFVFYFFQDAKAFVESRSPEAADRCAIGFVVRGLKNKRDI